MMIKTTTACREGDRLEQTTSSIKININNNNKDKQAQQSQKQQQQLHFDKHQTGYNNNISMHNYQENQENQEEPPDSENYNFGKNNNSKDGISSTTTTTTGNQNNQDIKGAFEGDANQQQQPEKLPGKLRTLVATLLARRKETKMDNLEAMINESALKLLQQKELVFKQSSSLQLETLCKTTKFNRRELKWLYSGWKVACTDGCGGITSSPVACSIATGAGASGANDPLAAMANSDGSSSYGSQSLSSAYYGIINEHQFQQIYAQFFPYGGDCSFYAKYVFQAMFGETLVKNGGFITFADYAHALSNLLRGSVEEKIDFVFRLYDLNNDNVITLDELSKIFFAVYRLLGDNVNLKHDQLTYEAQAEKLYNKIDLKQTGSITREQFHEYCIKDTTIVDTIKMLEMSICSSA